MRHLVPALLNAQSSLLFLFNFYYFSSLFTSSWCTWGFYVCVFFCVCGFLLFFFFFAFLTSLRALVNSWVAGWGKVLVIVWKSGGLSEKGKPLTCELQLAVFYSSVMLKNLPQELLLRVTWLSHLWAL